MRILYLTDTHLTAKNPASRLDVYETVTLEKLNEIGSIIKDQNVDMVIHGGDIFHSAKVSLKYTGKIAQIINSWNVPVLVDVGNHDSYGYNIDTIDQTTLGLLQKTNVVELLTRDTPKFLDIDGLSLVIEGQEYYKDIDLGVNDDYRIEHQGDYNILVTHSMLLDRPFYPGIPHTLIKDVKTDADLVLSGHYHPGFKEITIGKTTFINPGSTMRVESDRQDMPKVVLFDFKNIDGAIKETHEYIYLKAAKPREEVFDFEKILKRNNKFALISEFQKSIEDLTNLQTKTSAIDIVMELAKADNIDSNIIDKTIELITNAEQSADDENDILKGYQEKPYELYIVEIELVNFQSHSHTVINFTEGLNAIIGESGKGKTAILIALYWCMFNEPKGDDFIRTGQKSCSVKVTFNDGSSILRQRTRSSSGTYEVLDTNGELKVFKGFGSDIPVEVYNAHQMMNVTLAKGKKSKINIKGQFDPPFLLSEPVSVKASALGRLIGAQTMDIAIRDCSKSVLDYSKKMTFYSNLIKEEEKKLDALTELENKRNLLNEINKLTERLEGLKNTLNTKKELLSKLNKINSELDNLFYEKNKLDLLDVLKSYNEQLSENINKLSNLYDNKNMIIELNKINNYINSSKKEVKNISHILDDKTIDELKDKVKFYEDTVILNNKFNSLTSELKELQSKSIDDLLLKELKANIELLIGLTGSLETLSNHNNSLKLIDNELLKYSDDLKSMNTRLNKGLELIKNTKNEFSEYLEHLDLCPVCNQVIDTKILVDGE